MRYYDLYIQNNAYLSILIMAITNLVRSILIVGIASIHTTVMKFVQDHTRSIISIPVLMFIGEFICFGVYKMCLKNNRFVTQYHMQINSTYNRMKLIIPTIFDILGTIFLNFGLIFLPSPLYMILKGFGLVSVVVLSRLLLKKKYDVDKYIGVSIIFVGMSISGIGSTLSISGDKDTTDLIEIGIILVMIGYTMFGFQYIVTEKLLKDCNPHPLEMVGMEGLAGCSFFALLLPLAYIIHKRFSLSSSKTWCNPIIKSFYGDCFTDIFTSTTSSNKIFIDMPHILNLLFSGTVNALIPVCSWLLIICFAAYNYLLVDLISHTSATAFALLDPMKMIIVSVIYILLFYAFPAYSAPPLFPLLYGLQLCASIVIISIGYLVFYEKIKLKCLHKTYGMPAYSNPSSTDTSLNVKDSIISGEELVSEEAKLKKR